MKVGGRALFDAQHQRGKLTDGRTIAYAGGLMVLHYKGLPEVSHSGSTAGYSAWLGRYPEQGLSVAVLCNLAGTNATQLGHQVADVYLSSAIPERTAKDAVTVDAAALAAKAGMYRSVRDHVVVNLALQDGQLRLDRRDVLKPVSGDRFAMGDDGGRVEFQGARMLIANETDEGNWYEKVEHATPSRADLEAMAGEYVSDEAEVAFKVELEQDGLVIHRRPDAKIPLTPTYRDGFSSSMGSVRFVRDGAGRIAELSVGESRVWDLRFRRVR
jgi:hypothetical protein